MEDHGTHLKGLIILPGVYNQKRITGVIHSSLSALPGRLEETLCRPPGKDKLKQHFQTV